MTKKIVLRIEMEKIFREKGGEALIKAKNEMTSIYKTHNNLSQALNHFSNATLRDPLPVFPALITISCEGVGGNAEIAVPFGVAVFLIASAADLHDDIIDQSFSKGPKKTVFGRFGSSETILAGDTLLVHGLTLLNEALASISKEQVGIINRLVASSIFELCIAESLETGLRKERFKIKPEDFEEVIRLKAGFPELSLRIGAILGRGNMETIDIMGEFGRTFGVVSTDADEFSDLLNSVELANRLKNECPPLPLIYALRNRKANTELLPFLKSNLSEDTHEAIVNIVLGVPEVKSIAKNLQTTAKSQIEKIGTKIKRKSREELEIIILAPLEFLGTACSSS